MTPEWGRNSRLLLAVAWGIAGAALANHALHLYRGLTTLNHFDDAYMFIRYAKHLLAGQGLAWNPGEGSIFGVTSLLHLAEVTLVRAWLPFEDSTITRLCSGTASLAVALALVALAASRSPVLPRAVWAGLLLPPLMLHEAFTVHALTGMDTMLSMLCNISLIAATLGYVAQPRPMRLAVLLGAAYLTFLARVDNGIYATLFPALALGLLSRPGARRRAVSGFLVGIVALLAADALVKYLWLGDLVPLSHFAKRMGYYESYLGATNANPIENFKTFYGASLPFLVVMALCARRCDVAWIVASGLPVVLTSGFLLTVVHIMGQHSRFYYPSLPFVVMGAVLVLDRWLREPRSQGRHGELLVRVLVASSLIYLVPMLIGRTSNVWAERFAPSASSLDELYVHEARDELPFLGWRFSVEAMLNIVEGLPAGSRVALSEHGRIGAAAPQLILVDLAALHDREFAHRGFSMDGLLASSPDLIWGPHYHYAGMLEAMLCDDRFWDEYDYYPHAFDYGIALRRSSALLPVLRERIGAEWKRRYDGRAMLTYLARRSTTACAAGSRRLNTESSGVSLLKEIVE